MDKFESMQPFGCRGGRHTSKTSWVLPWPGRGLDDGSADVRVSGPLPGGADHGAEVAMATDIHGSPAIPEEDRHKCAVCIGNCSTSASMGKCGFKLCPHVMIGDEDSSHPDSEKFGKEDKQKWYAKVALLYTRKFMEEANKEVVPRKARHPEAQEERPEVAESVNEYATPMCDNCAWEHMVFLLKKEVGQVQQIIKQPQEVREEKDDAVTKFALRVPALDLEVTELKKQLAAAGK